MEKPEVVNGLATCLGNAVVLSFKAQGHHWNVEGSDFSEFHSFFQKIYEDVFGSLDDMAENMRKLDATAPYKLIDFARLSELQDMEVGTNAIRMCQDLYRSNDIMIASLDKLFVVASEQNEQGIADFIAGRIDMHKKWRWQLRAHLAENIL